MLGGFSVFLQEPGQESDPGEGGRGEADWKVDFGFQGAQPSAAKGGFTDTVFAAQEHDAAQSNALVEQRRSALHGRGAEQLVFWFVVKGDPLGAPCMGSLCQSAFSDPSAGGPPVGYW